jgi:hypothetical protein
MEKRRLLSWHVGVLLLVMGTVLGTFLPALSSLISVPAALAGTQQKPFDKPPEGQTYVGAKECASCHFDQFLTWKQTKHVKGFEILPAKYKEDKSCLKCHSTGHGEKTGFESEKTTPNLAGTTCEACHGPGSQHAATAKQLGKKTLSDDEKAFVRSTIYKIVPKNACAGCHQAETHKKHPPYDK